MPCYTCLILCREHTLKGDVTMQDLVDKMLSSIPGAIAACVAEIDSGMALASKSNSAELEPELAAAYNAEVIKQKMKAKKALGLDNENIDDILITLSNQYHVIMIVPGNQYFIYVATSKDGNLAIIRATLRKMMQDVSSKV